MVKRNFIYGNSWADRQKLTEVLKKTLAERFIYLVQEQCSKEGLETEASFECLRL